MNKTTITKEQLKRLIKEEVRKISEQLEDDDWSMSAEEEYDPYSPGPREYSDEPESIEYDEQEAWEWDREIVDDEWEDYGEDY